MNFTNTCITQASVYIPLLCVKILLHSCLVNRKQHGDQYINHSSSKSNWLEWVVYIPRYNRNSVTTALPRLTPFARTCLSMSIRRPTQHISLETPQRNPGSIKSTGLHAHISYMLIRSPKAICHAVDGLYLRVIPLNVV